MIYLLDGTEIYQMSRKKKELLSQRELRSENIQVLDGSSSSFSLSDALSSCATISLFSEKRAVVIDSPSFLRARSGAKAASAASRSAGKRDRNVELLKAYCREPSPDSDLIFYCYGYDADKRTREYKTLSAWFGKTVTPLHYGQLSPWELQKQMDILLQKNHLHLTREARQVLEERVAGSTTQFYAALEKLLLYGQQNLDAEDIRHLVSASPDINIWKFGDAFLHGSPRDILRSYQDLTEIERMSPQSIIPLLSYRLRTVYDAVRLQESGMSLAARRSYTGRYNTDKDAASAGGLSSQDLLYYLSRLADLDQQIKAGRIGEREGFEQFLLRRIQQCSH